jgi:hypothetical protein
MAFKKINGIEKENIKLTFTYGDVKCEKDGKLIPLRPEQLGIPMGYGPPKSYYDAMKNNALNGTGNWVVTTGRDSYATFFLCNDTLGRQTGTTFIRLEANSSVKITVTPVSKLFGSDETKTVVVCTKGTLKEDPDIKSMETFDAVWNVLTNVNTKFLKDKFEDEKKAENNKDKLATILIASCATAAGATSACSGIIGGPFAVALEAANQVAQWLLKTNMSYSLACIYMKKPPTQVEFKDHLLLLLGGKDDVVEAFNEAGEDFLEAAGETYENISGKDLPKTKLHASITRSKTYRNSKADIILKLRAKLGRKFAAKLVKAAKKVVPLAGAIYGAISDAKETAKLGKEVKDFYIGYDSTPAAKSSSSTTTSSKTAAKSSKSADKGKSKSSANSKLSAKSRSNSKPKPATATKPKPKSTTKPKPKSTTKPKAKSTTKPKPKSTTKPKPKSTTKPKAKSTTKPKPKSTTKPKPKSTTKPKAKSTIKPKPKSTTKPKAKSTTKPKPKSTTKPKAKSASKPRPAKEPRKLQPRVGHVSIIYYKYHSVTPGTKLKYVAYAYGKDGAPCTVNYSLLSGANNGTTISKDGLLTVGANQTLGPIIVKVTSTFDPSKNATATVMVKAPRVPYAERYKK